MEYINCPECKASIENDSCFCDQCGWEVKICPQCGQPGKKKFCGVCGKPMIVAKDAGKENTRTEQEASNIQSAAATHATANPRVVAPVTPPPAAAFVSSNADEATRKRGDASVVNDKLQLFSVATGIRLEGINGGVIGRKKGDYVQHFANQDYVSGTHAKLEFRSGTWYITDLGSTNGTMVNGLSLTPEVAHPIPHNAKVGIATIEFVAELF